MPCGLLLAIVLLLIPVPAAAQAVVSELSWAGSDLSAADEWIELSPSSGTGSLSLSGWTIYSLSASAEQLLLTIGPLDLAKPLVISNYAAAQSRLAHEPALVATAVSLLNVDLHLQLRRPDGSIADDVVLGSKPAGHTGAGGGIWATAERFEPLRSGADPANWRTASVQTGLDAGAPLLGSPGSVDWFLSTSSSSASLALGAAASAAGDWSSASASSLPADPLLSPLASSSLLSSAASSPDAAQLQALALSGRFRITELLADPVGNDDGEWIEVANLSTETLDINGVLLQRRGLSRSYRFVEVFGSGGTLEPGQHLLIRREQSLLTLPNDGGEVFLAVGETVIDTFAYYGAVEGVSAGLLDQTTRLFCRPTPGAPNEQRLPTARLAIQGGALSGIGRVSLNVTADLAEMPGDTSCRIDFGDGSLVAESCNPSSHTFNAVGSYDVSLSVQTVCGEIAAQPLVVNVWAAVSSSAAAVLSASSSSLFTSSSSSSPSGTGQRSCSPSAATGVSIAGALPNPADDDEIAEEITLHNDTDRTIDLCGWILDDASEGSRPFALDGLHIPAGQRLTLPRPETGLALNNDGDEVRLFAPGANVPIQVVAYDKVAEDQRVGPDFRQLLSGGVASASSSVQYNVEPFLMGKSPPRYDAAPPPTVLAAGEVVISEVLSHPEKGQSEWIEIENRTTRDIDLSGWLLDDDPDGGSAHWLVTHGTVVEAGNMIMFSKDETKLSLNDSGDRAELRRGSQVIDTVEVPALKSGVSFARGVDGQWCRSSLPTPGETNECDPVEATEPVQLKNNDSQKLAEPGLGPRALLASLRTPEGVAPEESDSPPGANIGLITWFLVALLVVGAVMWVWMHFDEWQHKLRHMAE